MVFSDKVAVSILDDIYGLLGGLIGDKKARSFVSSLPSVVRKSFKDYVDFCDNEINLFRMTQSMNLAAAKSALGVQVDCENYYDYMNALTFFVSDEVRVMRTDSEKLMRTFKTLDELPFSGCIVNLNENMLARLSKAEYSLRFKSTGKTYGTVYSYTITFQPEGEDVMSQSVIIIPELYPRLFSNEPFGKFILNKVECEAIAHGIGAYDVADSDLYIIPNKLRENDENFFRYYDELISLCVYCVDKYMNRKMASKTKAGTKVRCKVTVFENDKKGIEHKRTDFISLSDYVHYERQERISHGGHHASPCRHVRRGYWRHYKSGKRVWVNSTIVNKDKDAKAYKV